MKNKTVILAVITLLVIGSWTSLLEQYSENYINDSLADAGVAYGTARGINALVSMFQTTEIGAGLGISGSITIGEVLDPLNDLIERFSDVMTIVISSLILQKILLLIVSNKIFTVALTVLGSISGLVLLLKNTKYFKFTFRLLLIFVVIRFSLIIVILLNSSIDAMFISHHIENGNSKLSSSETELSNTINSTDLSAEKIEELNKSIVTKKAKKKKAEKKLISAKQNTDKIDESFFESVIGSNDEYILLKKKEEKLEDEIKKLNNEIETINNELNGDSSIYEQMSNLKDNLSPSVIAEKITSMVDNIFELLVLFVLKTILIPITFIYMLRGLVKGAWNMEINFDNK